MLRVMLSALAVVAALTPADAADRKISGKVMWGSLETSIEASDGTMYTLASGTRMAGRIFDTCQDGDACEVTGTIKGDEIVNVKRVRKLAAK